MANPARRAHSRLRKPAAVRQQIVCLLSAVGHVLVVHYLSGESDAFAGGVCPVARGGGRAVRRANDTVLAVGAARPAAQRAPFQEENH